MELKNIFHKLTAPAVLALACTLGLTTGCEDYDNKFDRPVSPFLLVENLSLNFGEDGNSDYTLEVRCNEAYDVRSDQGLESWCQITKLENGDLKLNVHENEEKNIRRGRFFIQTRTQADTINVAQLGWGKAILVSKSTFNVDESGEKLSVDVTANVEYTFDAGADTWIEVPAQTRGAHDVVTTTRHFTVKANKEAKRIGAITVKDAASVSDIEPVVINIIQKGLEAYSPGAPELGEDIKLVCSSADGDGAPKTEYAELIDGDLSSSNFWQAFWKAADGGLHPVQYIEFTFNEKVSMDYMVYRCSYTGNLIKDVKISVQKEGSEEWTEVFAGELPKQTATRMDFNSAQTDVVKVRMDITSGWGGVYRCTEMEFYRRDPKNFDYRTLYKDPACTELLDGVTEEDILNCGHSFFKNLAWYMYNDKYPRQFRIAQYKAYPKPDTQAAANKTAKYSLLDNPTGISVQAGEQLAVMADLKGLKSVNIRVQNLDQPGKDGFGGDEYTVVDGINTFTMKNKGLVYVMYHTDKYQTAQPITLHFTSSKVNGYYDSENPELKGRWKELLDASVDTHFDVLGKYVHMTFPTRTFLNYTKDVDALIELYDNMIYRQQEFLGLTKYDRMFGNRSYFHVIYSDAYMYATDYHTAYIESTLKNLADETQMAANCWGPAHELGHIHQTRPGLKWHGTTEVTNNITAIYVQTAVFGEPSRLQTQAVDGFPSRYGKAWTKFMAAGTAHNLFDDVFCKLVPFWQLQLYYGEALGQTPMKQEDHGGFYPEVYEYVRSHENPSTDGKCQLEFIYNCCQQAKADLTDFFAKWGFLTPVDATIGDYGDKRFLITQNEIDDLLKRVAALGYSKPGVALEYICDNTVDLYRDRKGVTAGTAAREGNAFTLNNWQNVAAFEVTDAQGKLLFAIEGTEKSFTLPTDWQSGYKLYAVSATGDRTDAGVK